MLEHQLKDWGSNPCKVKKLISRFQLYWWPLTNSAITSTSITQYQWKHQTARVWLAINIHVLTLGKNKKSLTLQTLSCTQDYLKRVLKQFKSKVWNHVTGRNKDLHTVTTVLCCVQYNGKQKFDLNAGADHTATSYWSQPLHQLLLHLVHFCNASCG